MQSLISVLDFYVGELKKCGEFSAAKFVFAGNYRKAQYPVTTEIIACGTGEQSFSQEHKSGRLLFTVYGKSGDNQRELISFTDRLLRAIDGIESGFEVEKILLCEPEFEGNLCVWCQGIEVRLSKSLKSTAPLRITLSGKELCVVDFEEKSHSDYYAVKEFLCGPVRYEKGQDSFELLLTLSEETDFPTESFVLCEEVSGTLYSGCRVLKKQVKIKEKALVYQYTLSFEQKACKEE